MELNKGKTMKRILFLILFLALIFTVNAQEKITITLINEGRSTYTGFPQWAKDNSYGFENADAKIAQAFEMLNPGVRIEMSQMDSATGTAITFDAALAAGRPPDIIESAEGKVAKVITPEWAIEVGKYVDLSDYTKLGLAPVTKNGKVLGLPMSISSSAPTWNMDMLDKIGYRFPSLDKWTTDEFLSLARKLKAKGHYVTALFFKNQSSDMWWMNWFYAFGARQYAPNDYTKSTLNTPAALKALKFMKQLVDEGLVVPNPGEIDDDMALDMWAKGQIAMLSMQIGHTVIVGSYVEQKIIPKQFKITMTEFPHAIGLQHTPVYTGPSLVIGHKGTNEYKNKMIAKFMEVYTGFERQWMSGSQNFPTRQSVIDVLKDSAHYLFPVQIKIISEAGVIDRGSHLPVFMKTRAAMFPLMQDYMIGKMTAENVLKNYEKTINDILSGK